MIKTCILFLIFAYVPLAAQQNSDSSNVLENVVVQATFKAGFEEDKLPLNLDFDYKSEAIVEDDVDWRSLDEDKKAESKIETENYIASRISAPEFAQIHPAPVKNFRVQFKKLQHWQLDVSSGDGSLFASISGDEDPPELIAWDGLSSEGEILTPGETYAYSFTAIDKAGNKRTFPGKAFEVPAFYLQKGDSLIIGLSDAALFSRDGLRLLPAAKAFAKEVAALVRYHLSKNSISWASQNPSADRFVDLIEDELIVEDRFFTRSTGSTGSRATHTFFYVKTATLASAEK